jgi:hypothetical protein
VAGYHEHFVRRLQLAHRRHLSDEALLVLLASWFGPLRQFNLAHPLGR